MLYYAEVGRLKTFKSKSRSEVILRFLIIQLSSDWKQPRSELSETEAHRASTECFVLSQSLCKTSANNDDPDIGKMPSDFRRGHLEILPHE